MSKQVFAAQLAIIKQMSGQVSRGSAGDYQADEQAGVRRSAGDYQADERAGAARLSWRLSSRRAGRFRVAQLSIIKQMSSRCHVAQLSIIKQMSRQVSRGSAGDYQADEQAFVAGLSCRLSSR